MKVIIKRVQKHEIKKNPITNIRDFGFEKKIINNTKIKIDKQETFQADKLVKHVLTSLMPENKK